MMLPLIVGLVLCTGGAAAGFFGVSSGRLDSVLNLVAGGGDARAAGAGEEDAAPAPLVPAAFVALDPLVVSLSPASDRGYLRFSAQLEVAPEHVEEVEAIRPRIVDVLNGYLRAVDLADLEDPAALVRLRAQMLRRLQVVAGEGRIRDLLIMEFVLN